MSKKQYQQNEEFKSYIFLYFFIVCYIILYVGIPKPHIQMF